MNNNTYPYQKQCLYCGSLFQGRRNAKFCLDNHRALYHAAKNRDAKKVEAERYLRYKSTIDVLIRNSKILDRFIASGDIGVITKDVLIKEGFDFDLHTSRSKEDQKTVIWIFDIGLKRLKGGAYQIISAKSS